MIAIEIDKVKRVISTFDSDLEEQRKNALTKLGNVKRDHSGGLNTNEIKFLDAVISHFEKKNFLSISPTVINKLVIELDEIPSPTEVKKKKKESKPKTKPKIIVLPTINSVNLSRI